MKKSTFKSFENLNNEKKIRYGKMLSIFIIAFITMCYSLSYAINSSHYVENKNNDAILNSDYIYSGVYIEDVPVGGLTVEQAEKVAQDFYNRTRLERYNITVATDYGYRNELTYDELGAEYNMAKAAQEAYEVGRSGSRDSRLLELDDIYAGGEHIPPEYTINEDKLNEVVENIITDVNKEYSLKGLVADFDRTYEMIYDNVLIKESNLEIYVPSVAADEQ